MSTSLLLTESLIETPSLTHLSEKDYDLVYEPAEDTFLFLDALEQDLKLILERQVSICLEIGSGSGIISTAVAHALGASAFCLSVDLNPAACRATQQTAMRNGVHVEVINGDLADSVRGVCNIDLLLFNPPYVPTPSEELRQPETPLSLAWAGGEKGREVIDRFLPKVSELLAARGLFYLVVIAANGVDEIITRMSSYGFHSDVVCERRVRGEHLMILRFQKKRDC